MDVGAIRQGREDDMKSTALGPYVSLLAALILLVVMQSGGASATTPAGAGIGPNTFELLHYQDSGYKYLVIPRGMASCVAAS